MLSAKTPGYAGSDNIVVASCLAKHVEWTNANRPRKTTTWQMLEVLKKMTETASTDIEIEIPPPPAVDQQDEFVANLSKIYQRLKDSKKLKTSMKEVE